MKLKNWLFVLIFSLSQTVLGQAKQQTVTSKIEKVTVFTSGAQVSRSAKTGIPQGKTELIFAGISPNIDKQSIQLKGEGSFTILSVIHQVNYLNEEKRREETATLESRKVSLNNKLKGEQSKLAVFKNEENILAKNQVIGGSNTGLKTADLKEAVDFQRSRLTEVLLQQIELETNIQKLDSSIQLIEKQLKALNNPRDFATSEVLVTVSAKEQVNAAFELNYFVNNAGWFATYDLRVKDISNPIDLTLKANIFQNSGEDWKDVKLTISNGNPTESGIAPRLNAWYLRFGYPRTNTVWSANTRDAGGIMATGTEVKGRIYDYSTGDALFGASVLVKGTTIGTVADLNGNYSLKLPENAQSLVVSYVGYESQEVPINSSIINIALDDRNFTLQEVVAIRSSGVVKKAKSQSTASIPLATTEKYQPTTLSFDIDVPYTVLNDAKVYVADLRNQSIPALYEYFAVPKLAKEAYLTAKITDWEDLNLLEGEVNLFFEGAFLGKSILDTHNTGDTLDISLGKDKGIVIDRKKLKEFSTKQFLSSNKTDNRAYEISVRNNKAQNISIVIEDQFPISTTKEIKVEDEEYEGATLDENTKILTWKYELAAKEEKKHVFKYSVKYPKRQIVILD